MEMEVKERIAYLRGLIEGADTIPAGAAARTVWDHLLTVCDELADGLSELEAAQGDLAAYVEAIDSDLYDLEEEVYGEELFDDEDEELDDPVVRTECPRCGEEVYFDEELLYDDGDVEISCPECGEVLYRGRTNGRGVEDEDRLASLPESQE
ncbi:MAG: hypothetical protein C0P71_000750 [Bacillota bacterium]